MDKIEPVSYTHLDVYKRQVPGISEETPGSWKSEAEPPSASPDGNWLETVSDAELFSSSAQAVIGDIWRTNKKDSKTRCV